MHATNRFSTSVASIFNSLNENKKTNINNYFCLNKNVSLNKTSQLFNFTQISILNSNKIYTNVAINFVINNQTILSNYSLNYTFNLFGSFAFAPIFNLAVLQNSLKG